jgi:uncharacterized surface protein with fasciclin (FAS1) repeats
MKRTILNRGVAAAAVLTLSLGLAACGDDSEPESGSDDTTSESSAPADDMGEDTGEATGAGDQVFGDACSAVPTEGDGSFDGMVDDPVATAATANPLLSTLVAAVTAVPGLADTLNGAEALTVFAPTNDAFGKIPEADLNAVLADQKTLTAILSHHVIGENLGPDAIVGEHDTLNKDVVTVEGDVEAGLTVDGGAANVICGNVPTANATVYIIDSVLMPTS